MQLETSAWIIAIILSVMLLIFLIIGIVGRAPYELFITYNLWIRGGSEEPAACRLREHVPS